MKDYYKILNISRTASSAEIKNAYRKLSLLYHPDRNNGEEKFNHLFSEINEAYQTLYKEENRSRYDYLWTDKESRAQSTHHSYRQEQSYIQPIIERFFVDKIFFRPGDTITITWNTLYADSIELRPFGPVDAQGVKKIKINQSNPYIEINLIAFNRVSRRYYTSKIVLENISHPDSKNYSKKSKPFNENQDMIFHFFSLEGKIDRFTYFKRLFGLVFLFLFITPFIYIFFDNPDLPMLFFYLFAFILTIIQTAKRLNALNLSWFFCILLLVPYLNIIVLLLLFTLPNSKKSN